MSPFMIDPGRLCQLEILVFDLAHSLRFYEQAFGWRPVPAEMHEYVVLEVPEDCPFGISLIPAAGAKGQGCRLVPYFAVDDPMQVIEAAEKAGGKRRFGPRRVGPYGEIHQIVDPDGQCFGLFVKTKDQGRSTESSTSSFATVSKA